MRKLIIIIFLGVISSRGYSDTSHGDSSEGIANNPAGEPTTNIPDLQLPPVEFGTQVSDALCESDYCQNLTDRVKIITILNSPKISEIQIYDRKEEDTSRPNFNAWTHSIIKVGGVAFRYSDGNTSPGISSSILADFVNLKHKFDRKQFLNLDHD